MAKQSRFIKEIQRIERKEPWRQRPARSKTKRTPEPPPASEEGASDSSEEEREEEKE